MKQLLNTVKAIGVSAIFVVFGVYIFNSTDAVFGKFIGVSNILFFSGLLIFGFVGLYNQTKKLD